MGNYRNSLPQLSGDIFLADAGIETDLMFNHGLESPEFAAHLLLSDAEGRRAMTDYFHGFLELARIAGAGLILDSQTWKAHPHWADVLGASRDDLRDANRESIAFIAGLRDQYSRKCKSIVLNGIIGPCGDGYAPDSRVAAAEAEGERGAGTVPDFHEVAEEVASRAGGKKSRHRSRRRGRGKKTSAAEGGEKSASTPEGEAVRAEPQEPGDAGEQGDGEPGEAAESGGTADPAGGAESAGEERKGRRRGRRRRRRKKVPAAEEGKESADVAAEEGPLAAAETFEGAEGTLSEEAAPRTGEEEPEEAEEEAGEEGAPEAKGAKKVMLIDGAHPEEIRVAILREGVLEYFEVENQRRKLFKGNIYKAKVVNVAQAIEAAFVDFGGG